MKTRTSPAIRGRYALPRYSPLRISLLIAGVYLLVGIVYITVSGTLAAGQAYTVDELKRIEIIKGVIFIVVTATILAGFCLFLLTRIARTDHEITRQREALILSENRALAGVFAASVAHDINNILTVVEYIVSELMETVDPREQEHAHIQELNLANERLKKLARRLMTLAGCDSSDAFEVIDLAQITEETVELARTHKQLRECTIDFESTASALPIFGNATLIHQMILNLVVNAGAAAGAKGEVRVRLEQGDEGCRVEVHDNGPGIPEEQRSAVFTPFFSTKDDGTGLGLLSVSACAEAHHGKVEVQDSPLGGACFRVTLQAEAAKATLPVT